MLDRIALRSSAWFPIVAAQLSGNLVGRVLPGGGVTAAAFSSSMLRRAGVETGEAAAAFGASTLLQIATALALPVLALPAILGGVPISHSLQRRRTSASPCSSCCWQPLRLRSGRTRRSSWRDGRFSGF